MSRQWPILATALALTCSAPVWGDTLDTRTVFFQEVSWSPDGSTIAFTAMSNQRPAEIYTMALRGKVVTRLTENDAFDGWSCWSKDGSQIYFSSKRDGNDEIYVMKVDGGDAKRLTNNPARDAAPCVSPDGTEIAFISDRDGNEEIYIMSVDGATTERLTTTPAREFNPHWSPNGQQIVCYSEEEGKQDRIIIFDAASATATLIGSDTTSHTFPSWTADGNAIVYCSSPATGEGWIYSASLDGTKNDKLLPLPAFYAAYSPDGKRIAYIGGGWPSSNIYVIDYTDGTLRCLTCDLSLAPEEPEAIAKSKPKSNR